MRKCPDSPWANKSTHTYTITPKHTLQLYNGILGLETMNYEPTVYKHDLLKIGGTYVYKPMMKDRRTDENAQGWSKDALF